ncbi:MAG: class I SAM-dependent methyltransferase [Coriobacteriia bacterium]|nr:class I SAM-dependent methyltransferase [Coriobacteriia bacterium]
MNQLQRQMLDEARGRRPDATMILEVGCGQGAFLNQLTDVYPSAELVGIDISAQAIEAARRRSFPSTPIQWHVASVEHLPFSDETFDVVFAGKTMHHWENKQRALSQIARVLKDEGLLVLGDPFTDGPLRSPWFNRLNERLDGGTFTSLEDLKSMLAQARLHLVTKQFVPWSGKTLSVCVISK